MQLGWINYKKGFAKNKQGRNETNDYERQLHSKTHDSEKNKCTYELLRKRKFWAKFGGNGGSWNVCNYSDFTKTNAVIT